ncbi:MAG: hypothetical protein AAGH57_09525 [Pseudomonadota bacterium]
MSKLGFFQELGRDYLEAIEGAVGCPIDAKYPGLSFDSRDLQATLHRFYRKWALRASQLRSGYVDFGLEENHGQTITEGVSIEHPLRPQMRDDVGIFLMCQITDATKIRSILMFADAVFFWDPFEMSLSNGTFNADIAELGLAYLMPLRPLIKAGLVIPAQMAFVHQGQDLQAERAYFPTTLMWQAALGMEEYAQRRSDTSNGEFKLSVPEGILHSQGYLGHAENKAASLFLPDVMVPMMDWSNFPSYQAFCTKLDRDLFPRQLEYRHKVNVFESGFILDPAQITNDMIVDLRGRDLIFKKFRQTVLKSIEDYENAVADHPRTEFIQEFNINMQQAFVDLKASALVSNTWKEYVDESRSFSSSVVTKIASSPLLGKEVWKDMGEAFESASVSSVGNLLASSLKTYSRYRNTKILMDFAGAIRENHREENIVSI